MTMGGQVRIACPSCGESFVVPTEVLGVDRIRHQVMVVMDRSGLYGHLQACTGRDGTPAAPLEHRPAEVTKAMEAHRPHPDPELVGRIHQLLDGGHFIAKGGSGACTMCGVNRDACMKSLRMESRRKPCCGACGDGNTHPAPMESRGTCAEWGAEHGAKT